MLRITIEMIPHGDETKARKIGMVEISNDATGTQVVGSYNVVLKKTAPWKGALKERWKSGKIEAGPDDAEIMAGRVEGFDRIQRGPYDLLFRALRACGLAARNP